MKQLSIFDEPPPAILPCESSPTMTIEESFRLFDQANPEIRERLRSMSLRLRRSGWKRCGMKMLFEQLCWLHAIETNGGAYKINNNYTALYARLLMQHEPELAGFFELRDRRSHDE